MRRASRSPRRWAHPRSLGENHARPLPIPNQVGSSPLTRGKRERRQGARCLLGLIPAHAGKTQPLPSFTQPGPAHPRSRGENRLRMRAPAQGLGSSPLTRGKRSLPTCGRHRCGLIPAHAGKTAPSNNTAASHPAHPRSRGENADFTVPDLRGRGSSPLTRGKRSGVSRSRLMRGLIPAHAGKTSARCGSSPPMRAHPRSRGENDCPGDADGRRRGSSPLTRGKPHRALLDRYDAGLIPAHTGKTRSVFHLSPALPAHPRSRGENAAEETAVDIHLGSSPLTRGKRATHAPVGFANGLIPAHAGKTIQPRECRAEHRAHPRSRGENTWRLLVTQMSVGSSPLTRGKLTR